MLIGFPPKKQAAAPASTRDGYVYDVTTAEFETRIVKASMERPILLDFWAPWCGPCKQLGPILEQAVAAQNGKIALAKVDIDQNPEIAQAFRVQSIPMVVAMYMGQPVTAFSGARPKAEIDTLIGQLVQMAKQSQPNALDIPAALQEAAALLSRGDFMAAQQLYASILAQDEQNVAAYTGMARVLIAAGELDQAQIFIESAPEKIARDSGFASAKTALDLARAGPKGDPDKLSAQMAASDDPAAMYEYAEACFSRGRKEEALEAMITLIRKNRMWEEEKGRKQLLRYFEAWGPSDPVTVTGRKRLSAVLFS